MVSLGVRIVHLYADLMNVYGDRGNILALVRRAEWRKVAVSVTNVSTGAGLDPQSADVIFFGGGQDREQTVVSGDFMQEKAAAVHEAVERGAALLAVCGGYQLLGNSYTTVDGQELPGAGLFDARSIPGPRRQIGNVLVETHLDASAEPLMLVGFENHSGKTYLGTMAKPLGRVIVGAGNNGEDGTEGAVTRNAYGSYLHGSLLPKNPWLADRLLGAALEARYGEPIPLEPLDDRIEMEAQRAVAARIRATRRARSGAW